MSNKDNHRPFKARIGEVCQACSKAFVEGDYSTLVALGPGDDKEAQSRSRQGRPYNAVAVEVHWACATGAPNAEGEVAFARFMARARAKVS